MKKLIIIIAAVVLLAIGVTLFFTIGNGIDLLSNFFTKQPEEFRITYSDENGVQNISVIEGQTYKLSYVPYKEGYVFSGLFDSKTGGIKYVDSNGDSIVPFEDSKDMELFPQFMPKEYTLSFDLQGGSSALPTKEKVQHFSTIDLLEDAWRQGYSLLGWYTEPNGLGRKVTNDTVINNDTFNINKNTTDITIYAHWEINIFNVKLYILNDKEYNVTENITVPYGTPINSITTDILADETKRVKGWSYSPNSVSTNESIISDISLYSAEYEKIFVKITFDSDGGNEVPTKKILYEEGKEVSLPMTAKLEEMFAGWQDIGGNTLIDSIILNNSDDILLKAVWSKPTRIIFLEGENPCSQFGMGMTLTSPWEQEDIFCYCIGEELQLPIPNAAVKFHRFAGWKMKFGQYIGTEFKVTEAGKVYFFDATWSPYVKVSFITDFGVVDLDEDDEIEPFYITELNTPYPIPAAPKSRPGYVFKGWKARSNGQFTPCVDSITAKVPIDITITAIWEEIKYTIEYVTQYGSAPPSNPTYYYIRNSFTLDPASSNNKYYKFERWDYGSEIVRGTTGNLVITALYRQTYADYTYISTKEQFSNISMNMGGKYMLISDINMGSMSKPIGTSSWAHAATEDNPTGGFEGILDGDGHKISYSMTISGIENNKDYGYGLFGVSRNAEFKNITIDANIVCNTDINCWELCMGSLVGLALDSKFSNIKVTTSSSIDNKDTDKTYYVFLVGMKYTGATCTGGIVGDARSCGFTGCYNGGYVRSWGYQAYAGGIAGSAWNCTKSNCFNAGEIVASHGSWQWGEHKSDAIFAKTNSPATRLDNGVLHTGA